MSLGEISFWLVIIMAAFITLMLSAESYELKKSGTVVTYRVDFKILKTLSKLNLPLYDY